MGFVEEAIDGFEDFRGVFRDDADGRAIDDEAVLADGGFDGEILFDGQSDELGELEVDGAEAFEETNEIVGVAAADGEIGAAECSPGCGDREIEFFVANALEKLGVGSRTTTADGGKGAPLARGARPRSRAPGDRIGFLVGSCGLHGPDGQFLARRPKRLIDNKRVSGAKTTKAG